MTRLVDLKGLRVDVGYREPSRGNENNQTAWNKAQQETYRGTAPKHIPTLRDFRLVSDRTEDLIASKPRLDTYASSTVSYGYSVVTC